MKPIGWLLAVLSTVSWAAEPPTTVDLSFSGRALVYKGELSAAANRRLFALYERAHPKPDTLVITSAGGRFELGLALGEWVFRHGLAIEVPTQCNSACANYVFTAARQRTVGPSALIAFHGGMADTEDRIAQVMAQLSPERRQREQQAVRDFIRRGQADEAKLFKLIGIDPRITSYAYRPPFWPAVRKTESWTYSLAMFRRFGVTDIRVSQGERWFPRPANKAVLYIHGPDSFGCVPSGMALDVLDDCRGGPLQPPPADG